MSAIGIRYTSKLSEKDDTTAVDVCKQSLVAGSVHYLLATSLNRLLAMPMTAVQPLAQHCYLVAIADA